MPTWLGQIRQRLGPITFGLLAANVLIHLVFLLTVDRSGAGIMAALYNNHLALSPRALLTGQLWTLVTYGFLHDLSDPFHLLFNMLVLAGIGPQFERTWGGRRFLRFFLTSVVGGGVVQGVASLVTSSETVGASAGVLGLIVAYANYFPDAKMQLFFVLPVPVRHIVPIGLAIDAIFALSGAHVAVFAHIGGIAAAYWSLMPGRPRDRVVRIAAMIAQKLAQLRGKAPKARHLHSVDLNKTPRPGRRDHWN